VYVRTQAVVSIEQPGPILSVIFQGLDRYVNRISDTVAAKADGKGVSVDAIWEDPGMLSTVLRETALEMFENTPDLKKACYFELLSTKASATEEELLQKFLEYADRCSHWGGIIGIPYPDDQLWCVD
jgi:hypothetical protein